MNHTDYHLNLTNYRNPVQPDYVTNVVQGWQVVLLCRECQHLHAVRELRICCCRRVHQSEVADHVCVQNSLLSWS